MKFISPSDASMIAVIAEGSPTRTELRRHLVGLSKEAQEIVRAVINPSSKHKKAVVETAKAVRRWAVTNKRK